MSTTTTNYGLVKPELTDAADITAMNPNWDKLDDELTKRIPALATYYPVASAKNVDEVLDPFALVPVSAEVNPELFNAVGGTFAWVWTSFYNDVAVTSRRVQIATTYNSIDPKMAYRIYGANGWLAWRELATVDALNKAIASIPTPDVSGQIAEHNSDSDAHADIRAGAFPIEGGTVTGTEIGINNNRGKIFASGSVTRIYATDDPSNTTNQRYLNLYSQFFKEDISESLKVTERIDGVDTSYKIYGEHNITSGTTDLTAGTSELPSGHIYLVYE